MATVENLQVGKPPTTPSMPSHTAGVRQGNQPGNSTRPPGHLADGTATARRSTGINPQSREPIDRQSPNLSPA